MYLQRDDNRQVRRHKRILGNGLTNGSEGDRLNSGVTIVKNVIVIHTREELEVHYHVHPNNQSQWSDIP